MKAIRGLLKRITRREGRIGHVWRGRGVWAAESGSGKNHPGKVLSYGRSQVKGQHVLKSPACGRYEAESR